MTEVKAGAALGLQVADQFVALLPRAPHGHCHRHVAQVLQSLPPWQDDLHGPLCHTDTRLHAEQAAPEAPGQSVALGCSRW